MTSTCSVPPSSQGDTVRLSIIPDGLFMTDAQGLIERANDEFLEMVERTKNDVVGRHLVELLAPEDILTIVGFNGVFGEPAVQDASLIFILPNGSTTNLLLCSKRSAANNDSIAFTSRRCGSLHQELTKTSRWATSEQQRAGQIAATRDTLEKQNKALEHAQRELQAAYEQLKEEAGARERLEDELRLAQKLEAIGQLAAGVAHEINTPMQYIGDNIGFLKKGFEAVLAYAEQVQGALESLTGPEADELKKELRKARRKARLDFLTTQIPNALCESQGGVEHVSSIVRAMKSFTHMDQGEKVFGDINQAIRDTLAVAQNEYKSVARIHTELGELPPLRCFIGKLSQVFLNLLVNAAHAVADKGSDELGTITVRSRCTGSHVEIEFEDTGCGIPEDVKDRVYDQFFTTKGVGRGTGQGLALARNVVVEAHQGTIDFRSEVGVGTVFTLRLPCTTLSQNSYPPA